MSNNPFHKAVKTQLKARLALAGPTGSGKTWSALEWATVLAKGDPIALIDTERKSASLYADNFSFDVADIAPPYEPQRCVDALRAAEANGYGVVIIDSLTHFWQGEGGTLDMVDAAAQKMHGNKYAGWSVGTPALRHLVDTILGVDMHVIVTMRSKMDYVEELVNGKKTYVRVGMAPVMRDGIEYEFTVLGDVDLEHRIAISKSRCSALADQLVQPGRARDAAVTFLKWLESGEPEPAPAPANPDVVNGKIGVGKAKKRLLAAFDGDKDATAACWNAEFSDADGMVDATVLEALIARVTDDDEDPDPDGSGGASGPDDPGDEPVADDLARDADSSHLGDGDEAAVSSTGASSPDPAVSGDADRDPAPDDGEPEEGVGAATATAPAPAPTSELCEACAGTGMTFDNAPCDVCDGAGEIPLAPTGPEKRVTDLMGALEDSVTKAKAARANHKRELSGLQKDMHRLAALAFPDMSNINAEANRAMRDDLRHGLIRSIAGPAVTSSNDCTEQQLLDVCKALQSIIDGENELFRRANGAYELRPKPKRAKRASKKATAA